MTPAEELMAARDLISDPRNWTRHALARNSGGFSVSVISPYAVKFCVNGALCRASTGDVISYLTKAANDLGYPDTVTLNDESNHETVMEMFDRAIRLAKEDDIG